MRHRQLPNCLVLALLGCPVLGGCPARGTDTPEAALPEPPIAKIVPHLLALHGDERVDDYYWLREREDPEVVAYLEAENAYTAAMTAHTAPLRAELEREMAGRIEQDDSSLPYRERDFLYYARWQQGGDYPILARRPLDAEGGEAGEQVLLDIDALAQGHDYFETGGVDLSENQQLLAYASDTLGRRIYTIEFVDLRSGERLADRIPEVSGELVWANDDRTLYYVRQDPVTLRDHQVLRHTLGEDPADDELVYAEPDETFDLDLWKTKSRRFVIVESSQTLATEVRLLDASDPNATARVFQPRERGLEYDVDHLGDRFYVRTNLDAVNFRLMQTPLDATGKANWREVVGHDPAALFEGFEVFAGHLVLRQRRAGLIELDVRPLDGSEPHTIDFGEPAYVAWISDNPELDSTTLRFGYASLTTPDSIFDYDLATRQKTLRKQTKVLGGFDADAYVTERLSAPAPDGAMVPISLVRRRDTPVDGTAPLLLDGYGAYGSSIDAEFDGELISLLDRGFVYAIAHVRGGEELGRAWYEGGKLLNKRNTFADFIACAEHLIAERHADPERVFATGGSAGGLLIGAVVNIRPDLFAGAIAAVPFVDVVTTMLDESIPLTTFEWDEWGNPSDPNYYEYMLSYSPYDNVAARDYPALLVTAGFHDSQVQYWEPAKWVAKLRANKTDDNPLLLRTDMSAGHGGQAGRLESLEQTAFEYAFLLDLAGRSR
ncbi:S9 family peptidase [Nannocystaceae bacterium ST9]